MSSGVFALKTEIKPSAVCVCTPAFFLCWAETTNVHSNEVLSVPSSLHFLILFFNSFRKLWRVRTNRWEYGIFGRPRRPGGNRPTTVPGWRTPLGCRTILGRRTCRTTATIRTPAVTGANTIITITVTRAIISLPWFPSCRWTRPGW